MSSIRDFGYEKRRLKSRMRHLRGVIRGLRAQLRVAGPGCSGCKGNSLKATLMQYEAMQGIWVKLVTEEAADQARSLGKKG